MYLLLQCRDKTKLLVLTAAVFSNLVDAKQWLELLWGGGGLSMALTHLVISQFLLPHSFLFLIALPREKRGHGHDTWLVMTTAWPYILLYFSRLKVASLMTKDYPSSKHNHNRKVNWSWLCCVSLLEKRNQGSREQAEYSTCKVEVVCCFPISVWWPSTWEIERAKHN